jgi:peptide/nickel transport system permease protein
MSAQQIQAGGVEPVLTASETEPTGMVAARLETFWGGLWKQFKRDPVAVSGFYVVGVLLLIALLADFLANDKPYYLQYRGRTYFPIFKSYMVSAGLSQWPPELQNVEFKKLKGARAVYPPVPYRPTNIDLLAPYESPSRRHLFGTDRLGRDILAGMIHGSRISLSIGFVAVGIAVIIGVILGALAGYFGAWVDIVISRLFEIII